ncbi:hypothetical protein [Nocardia sp. NPDC050710]
MGSREVAFRLLESVLARYGTIEEFIVSLRVDPMTDTVELPVIDRPVRL